MINCSKAFLPKWVITLNVGILFKTNDVGKTHRCYASTASILFSESTGNPWLQFFAVFFTIISILLYLKRQWEAIKGEFIWIMVNNLHATWSLCVPSVDQSGLRISEWAFWRTRCSNSGWVSSSNWWCPREDSRRLVESSFCLGWSREHQKFQGYTEVHFAPAERWKKRDQNVDNTQLRKKTKWDFSYLRPGAILALVVPKSEVAISDVRLGAVFPSSREALHGSYRFSLLMCNNAIACEGNVWELYEVASLLTDQRKFEACTKEEYRDIPFLSALQSGVQSSPVIKVSEKCPKKPDLNKKLQAFAGISPLNDKQEEPAINFLIAEEGSVTLAQGYVRNASKMSTN